METNLIIILTIIALLVGMAKGGLGGTLGGMIIPVMSIFVPVQEIAALSLPLFIAADWLSIRAYWRGWDNRILRLTMPMGLIGVVVGTYLLANLEGDALRILLGILALVIGTYKLMQNRLQGVQYKHHSWHGWLAGLLGGTGSALASAGGPAYTAYLLLQGIPPRPFIATTAVFFAITNLTRVPSFVIAGLLTWETVQQVIWFLPLVAVGVWLGHKFIKIINPTLFEHMMIVLLLIAGLVLLFG